MNAKITLFGLYSAMEISQSHLFNELVLPDELDQDVFIDALLLRAGEFEVLYKDGDLMQRAVGVWCRKWSKTFERWVEVAAAEYNPIENYDRYEEWTDESESRSETQTGTEQKVSAYDSNDYSPRDRSDLDGHSSGSGKNEHHAHIHGNIGVTTSSAMQKEAYDIAIWNVYEHIADLFIGEFLLFVY